MIEPNILSENAERVVSSTFGDLFKLWPGCVDHIEPHEWDNKTPSEQRDWVIVKLAAAEAALTGCISAARSWRSDQLGLLFPKDRNNPDFHVDEQRESKLRAAIGAAKTEVKA